MKKSYFATLLILALGTQNFGCKQRNFNSNASAKTVEAAKPAGFAVKQKDDKWLLVFRDDEEISVSLILDLIKDEKKCDSKCVKAWEEVIGESNVATREQIVSFVENIGYSSKEIQINHTAEPQIALLVKSFTMGFPDTGKCALMCQGESAWHDMIPQEKCTTKNTNIPAVRCPSELLFNDVLIQEKVK